MFINLHHPLPAPLKGKPSLNTSQIWLQKVVFAPKEKIFIQAPSGTGKTTLIHMLYGLRRDFEGTVQWEDKQVSSFSEEQLAMLRSGPVSIIFQDLRLFPWLTVRENLSIKQAITNTVSMAESEEWMKRLGVYEKRDSRANTLSYGERQRIAIIRALLQPFQWLLMDEPFSHLDKENIAKAADLIREVADRNSAGIILADLDDNNYFDYDKKILL